MKLLGDGARRGDAKPWHFQKADRGARQGTLDRWGAHKEFKASKVVDRLASERSRAPFMADPKKAWGVAAACYPLYERVGPLRG